MNDDITLPREIALALLEGTKRYQGISDALRMNGGSLVLRNDTEPGAGFVHAIITATAIIEGP